jgi:hypothetical protein
METHWIVKVFDLLEHRCFGVIEIPIALEFGSFTLQQPEDPKTGDCPRVLLIV